MKRTLLFLCIMLLCLGGLVGVAEAQYTNRPITSSPCGSAVPQAATNGGSTSSVNWLLGYNATITLTASTTLTMSNPVSGCCYSLTVTQGGSGSYTVTFSPVPLAESGSLPVLSTTAGKTDVMTLCYTGSAYTIGGQFDVR